MNSAAKLLLLAALTGCQIPPPAPDPVITYKTKVVDSACAWSKIITISKEDALSDETARQILAHDRAWTVNCKK